jgi:hypothetical protein
MAFEAVPIAEPSRRWKRVNTWHAHVYVSVDSSRVHKLGLRPSKLTNQQFNIKYTCKVIYSLPATWSSQLKLREQLNLSKSPNQPWAPSENTQTPFDRSGPAQPLRRDILSRSIHVDQYLRIPSIYLQRIKPEWLKSAPPRTRRLITRTSPDLQAPCCPPSLCMSDPASHTGSLSTHRPSTKTAASSSTALSCQAMSKCARSGQR